MRVESSVERELKSFVRESTHSSPRPVLPFLFFACWLFFPISSLCLSSVVYWKVSRTIHEREIEKFPPRSPQNKTPPHNLSSNYFPEKKTEKHKFSSLFSSTRLLLSLKFFPFCCKVFIIVWIIKVLVPLLCMVDDDDYWGMRAIALSHCVSDGAETIFEVFLLVECLPSRADRFRHEFLRSLIYKHLIAQH